MDRLTDDDVIRELLKRLKAKDEANHGLLVMTKKLEDLNERLMESEKVKGHFLSNIRNEINNPLTFVLTMCALISKNGITDIETLKSAIGTIHKEAFHLNFQLFNIFAAAELEAGDAVLDASTVDIRALISSAIDSFQRKAAEKGVSVVLELAEGLKISGLFKTDSEKLQCIIVNLLANAIEYSHEAGHVEITVQKYGGGLQITVTDHGVGIDEKDQYVIFERFKQLDSGVAKSHAGHGLGLSVTKAMIELLNGTMSVKSGRGAGASFILTIPEMSAMDGTGTFSADGNNFFFEDSAEDSERF